MSGAALRDELRRAVSAGLYSKAEALLVEYRSMLDCLPCAPEREAALSEAAELIEWARRTVLAARAAAAAQLASLPAAMPRYRAHTPARHTWEMLG